MLEPILTDAARADLTSAWNYLADFSLAAADHFLDEFWDRVVRLASFPEIGRDRSELRDSLRSIVVQRHVVFFERSEAELRVVRIILGSRDIDAIFEN